MTRVKLEDGDYDNKQQNIFTACTNSSQNYVQRISEKCFFSISSHEQTIEFERAVFLFPRTYI